MGSARSRDDVLNCNTCKHGKIARCGHPLVAPFSGEPPTEIGSKIVEWCGAAIVVLQGGERSGPRNEAPPCPGFALVD